LDLIFSKISIDVCVGCADTLFLGLYRHHSAELIIDVKFCRFDTMNESIRRYKFKMADFQAIIDDMNGLDLAVCFVALFNDDIWRCFDKFVSTTCSRLGAKLPWMSRELRVA
jgi:hypothetical protein